MGKEESELPTIMWHFYVIQIFSEWSTINLFHKT